MKPIQFIRLPYGIALHIDLDHVYDNVVNFNLLAGIAIVFL